MVSSNPKKCEQLVKLSLSLALWVICFALGVALAWVWFFYDGQRQDKFLRTVGIALGDRMGWDGKSDNIDVEQRSIGDCSILDGFVPVHSMSGYEHDNPNCAGSWVEDTREPMPDITLVVIGAAARTLTNLLRIVHRACISSSNRA